MRALQPHFHCQCPLNPLKAFANPASPMLVYMSSSFATLSLSLNLAALTLTERKKSTPQSSQKDRQKRRADKPKL